MSSTFTGFGSSGTFIYSPDIRVWVATDNDGILDLSGDIISANISRNINAVSTFSCELDNRWKKYDQRIQRMNRIMVWLSRVSWLQCFSGYVTQAPFETTIPGAVSIQASCTLKRLENTYWDATIPEAQAILPGAYTTIQDQGQQFSDGGAGQGMVNVMTMVPDSTNPVFNPSQIHIQEIPTAFFQWATSIYQAESSSLDQTLVNQLIAVVDGVGVVAGKNGTPTAGQTQGTAPTGASIPYGGVGQASMYYGPDCPGGGDPYPFAGAICQNQSKAFPDGTSNLWGVAVHWGYDSLSGSARQAAISYLQGSNGEGAKLLITNNSNGNSVVCRAIDFMSAGSPRLVDMSTTAWRALNGSQSLALGVLNVTMVWADSNATDGPATGSGAAAIKTSTTNTNQQTQTVTGVPTNAGAAAAQAAYSQVGDNYPSPDPGSQGRETPKSAGNPGSFDCSGLAQWAYKQVGVNIPGTTSTQWPGLPQLPKGTIPQPGDLVFFQYSGDANNTPPDHVTICYGVNLDNSWTAVSAADPQQGVVLLTNQTWSTPSIYGIARPSGSLSQGSYSGTLNTGGSSNTNDASQRTAAGGSVAPTDNFNIIYSLPQIDPRAIMFYNSPRAFITDEPVLSTISQLCAASLRSFQSAPNGDFVAWFPDYFGVYGKTPVMQIRNIEITDFRITVSDEPIATHVAVVGETDSINSGITIADWLSVEGIVSVQETGIMNILFGSSGPTTFNSQAYLQKFGLRPYVVQKPEIRSFLLEFMYALFTFMDKWTDQYSTTVTTTFMPEIYPGMLIQLPDDQNLQVYVQAVQHNISRINGFTTFMTVTAPTRNGQILELQEPEPWFSVGLQNPTPIQ